MTDPLKKWDQLEERRSTSKKPSASNVWVWEDKYIVEDFNTLQAPEVDLTTKINNLKAFYMCYFGEITSTSNLGGLFVQLMATTPELSSDKGENLFKFSTDGKRKLSGYVAPKDLQGALSRFLDTATKKANQPQELPEIEAPITEPPVTGLADDEGDVPKNEEGGQQMYPSNTKTITTEDTASFKEAVARAFEQLLTEEDNAETQVAIRSLSHTAFFLILFMMRRITKRYEDLLAALSRSNIHKHYTDMVREPFGMTIPPPSTSLNRSLSQILSTQNVASRELYTMALWLLQTCTVGQTDTPVGLLSQKDIGLEAVLRATCMTHIAGSGMPLITLFVTVKTLFNKTERATLEWLAYPELIQGIHRIVELRSKQYEISGELKLFPYCRLVHQNYHSDLGYKGNENICYLMACLIDQHSPPSLGTGGARNALWTASINPKLKIQIEAAAKMMYSGVSDFKLTARYPGQISYGGQSTSGQTWTKAHVPTTDPTDSDEDQVVVIPPRR